MSDISPISRPTAPTFGGVQRVSSGEARTATPTRGDDKAEFSVAAKYLAKLAALPEVRQDLVDRVRQQIKDGTYDTPDKVDALMGELADDLRD